MKLLQIAITLVCMALAACADNNPQHRAAADASGRVGICILADETGPELKKLGLRSVKVAELSAAVRGALMAGRPVTIAFVVVDENAGEDPEHQLVLGAFDAPRMSLPQRPDYRKISGSVLEVEKAQERYHSALKAALKRHQTEIVKEEERAGELVAAALGMQDQMVEKFAKELERRRGRDYPHSDVVGAIQLAVHALDGCEEKVLILNSDCRDRVEYRPNREKPLTEEELPSSVTLVFCATAEGPGKEVLFKGRGNRMLKAEGVHKALEMSFAHCLETQQP